MPGGGCFSWQSLTSYQLKCPLFEYGPEWPVLPLYPVLYVIRTENKFDIQQRKCIYKYIQINFPICQETSVSLKETTHAKQR
jgi:hypothetical protein